MNKRSRVRTRNDNNTAGGVTGRLRNSRGFTLAEALITVLIMLLVTVIVVAGIPAAGRAYNNVVMASNAEVLLSTTMSALRNELSMAKDIGIQDESHAFIDSGQEGSEIIYYNPQTGSKSRISCNSGDNDIMYERYATDEIIIEYSELDESVQEDYNDPVRFMSEAVSDRDKELHVKYEDVSYDKSTGVVTFHNLKVMRKDNQTQQVVREYYSVRIITQ